MQDRFRSGPDDDSETWASAPEECARNREIIVSVIINAPKLHQARLFNRRRYSLWVLFPLCRYQDILGTFLTVILRYVRVFILAAYNGM